MVAARIAASVLAERATEWFSIQRETAADRFMVLAYPVRARLKVREIGWDGDALAAAWDWGFQTPAFRQASCSVILSDYTLSRHHTAERWDYVPHATD